MPIVETAALGTVSNEVLTRLELNVLTEFSCYETILKSDDDQIKMIILTLIKELDRQDFVPLLQIAAKDDHPRVRLFAEQLLGKQCLV